MEADVMFDWPEILALLFLMAGFIAAVFSKSAAAMYAVCFLAGLLFGRVWYKFKLTHCIPVFLIVMAFFLGFILGGIFYNLRIIALALLAGILIGYWLHKEKIIRTA